MVNLRVPAMARGRLRSRSIYLSGLLVASAIALASCQGQQSETDPLEEPGLTPTPAITTAPTPTPTPTPISPAPQAAPNAASSPLPNTLVKTWEPVSNVLYEFGPMTLTANQITWSSGQSSQYTLISSDTGYLLKLEPVPSFFDTPHPFVKLIPKAGAAGAVDQVEVAFYENEQKAKSDEYIMFGTYEVQ